MITEFINPEENQPAPAQNNGGNKPKQKAAAKKKSRNPDTGHAKNVANMRTLITYCQAMKKYNPKPAEISIQGLQDSLAIEEANLADMMKQMVAQANIRGQRDILFKQMDELKSTIMSLLKSSKAKKHTIDQARTYVRKLSGTRASKKPVPTAEQIAAGTQPATNSSSQRSFSQRLTNFQMLVEIARQEPLYAPNEEEFSVAGLETFLKQAQDAQALAEKAEAELESLRAQRNDLLYDADDNLYERARQVKEYVKGVYKIKSDEFKKIRPLKFTRPSRRKAA